MSESNSVTVEVEQTDTTENYAVYDAFDDEIVGTYIAEEAAEELGESSEFTVHAEGEDGGLSLSRDRETASYGVFSDQAEAVETTYVSHEVLAELTGQDADSDEYTVPESIGMDAEALEGDEAPSREEAAEALVAGADGDSESESTDSDESEVNDSDEEEVEISDEEIGLE
jgi:hypothetical protein